MREERGEERGQLDCGEQLHHSTPLPTQPNMPKDAIRAENVRRYTHVPVPPKNVASNFVAQNLPLAAMFLKNKALAWACLFFSIQSYLNEPIIKAPADESQPAIFRVIFALVALVTCYIDLLFPSIVSPGVAAIAKAAVETAQPTN